MAVNRHFNFARLQALILYIVARHEHHEQLGRDDKFGKTRLTKLLFWAEFAWFRRTGRPIAGGTYIKMPRGPMLDGLNNYLDGMERGGLLHIVRRPSGGHTSLDRPVPDRDPDTSLFSPDQLALVDELIREHWGETAGKVSDLSHEFPGWQLAAPLEAIPYGTATVYAPEVTEEDVRIALALGSRLGPG
jgi:hypothetical protein